MWEPIRSSINTIKYCYMIHSRSRCVYNTIECYESISIFGPNTDRFLKGKNRSRVLTKPEQSNIFAPDFPIFVGRLSQSTENFRSLEHESCREIDIDWIQSVWKYVWVCACVVFFFLEFHHIDDWRKQENTNWFSIMCDIFFSIPRFFQNFSFRFISYSLWMQTFNNGDERIEMREFFFVIGKSLIRALIYITHI